MCRQLRVPRATYYRWLHRQHAPSTPRARRHHQVAMAVQRVFDQSGGKAGRRQVVHLLAREGMLVSKGMVHHIMRERHLTAIRMRTWRKTTIRDPTARTAHIRNLCLDATGHRDFASAIPGTKCVGDITYLRTGEGWLYLAVVIDLTTRSVLGWSMQTRPRTDLVIDALDMAAIHGYVRVGTIFHSDRGAQYTSDAFQTWCGAHRITQSMGGTGVCWDNAVAESFFSSLKNAMFHQEAFPTRTAARLAVVQYIEPATPSPVQRGCSADDRLEPAAPPTRPHGSVRTTIYWLTFLTTTDRPRAITLHSTPPSQHHRGLHFR